MATNPVSINDATALGTAQSTDRIPVARVGNTTPTTISVGDVRTLVNANPVFTGVATTGATVADPDIAADEAVNVVNATLVSTSRVGANNNSALTVNSKVSPSLPSNCIFSGTSNFVFTEATNSSDLDGLSGYYAHVTHKGSGAITSTMRGTYNHITMSGSGTANQVFGSQSLLAQTLGTVSTARCFDARYARTGGACTLAYGYYCGAIDATTSWAFYAATGGAKSYFGGGIRAQIAEYADNAAAITAGLSVGDFYHTADVLKIVH